MVTLTGDHLSSGLTVMLKCHLAKAGPTGWTAPFPHRAKTNPRTLRRCFSHQGNFLTHFQAHTQATLSLQCTYYEGERAIHIALALIIHHSLDRNFHFQLKTCQPNRLVGHTVFLIANNPKST